MMRTTRSKFIIWGSLIGILFVGYVSVYTQQNIQFSQGKVEEGMSNSIGVPLGQYKGRGLDLPVTINYSSNVWRIDNVTTVLNNEFIAYQTITQAIYAEHSTAGWKSSLDMPTVEWPKLTDTYYYSGKTYCYVCNSGLVKFRVAKVTIHMPDGSAHEFRKTDIPYQDAGYIDMTGTFYAVDGSRLRYDSTGTDTGTLYMPDGTRYTLGHPYSTITDKNGNTQSYDENSRQWTDTLGRVIANPVPASPQAQDYTYNLPGLAGVNGGLQTYTFKWRNLANALTPDANNNTPALRYIASHYLPYPSSTPTAPNGNNFPQAQSTQYQSLFASGTEDDASVMTMVVGKGQSSSQLFNPVVLTEIVMPNGTSYKFSYDIYGEVDKIIYPTGAFEKYQMQEIGGSFNLSVPYDQANRGVVNRKLSIDGTTNNLLEWKYYKSETGFGTWGTGVEGADVYRVVAPDKTRTEVYKLKVTAPFHGSTDHRSQYWAFDYADGRNGSTVERRSYSTSTDGLGGSMLRRDLTQFDQTIVQVPPRLGLGGEETVPAYRNIRPTKEVGLILEGAGYSLTQIKTYGYDTTYQTTTGVDQTLVNNYHYAAISDSNAQTLVIGSIPGGALANSIETTFQNSSGYHDRNLLGLPLSVVIKDGNGSVAAKNETAYDEYSLSSPGNPTGWQDPQTTYRGNPTTVSKYSDIATNQHIDNHANFDKFGNVVATIDGKNYTSTIEYSSANFYSYPTKMSGPAPDPSGQNGSSSALETAITYDFNTALPLSVTDVNGQTTTTSYNDPSLRPKTVTPPTGGSQTVFEYNDTPGSLSIKVKKQIDQNNWEESTSYFDGLGRQTKTQKKDGTGDVFVETQYDNMGRPFQVCNPYRNGDPLYWTQNTYDDLGRVTKVKTLADGAEMNTAYSIAQTGTQIGTTVTVTDQANKVRRSITNALAQLTRVDEPTTAGLGAIDAPNQPTYYLYDALGNLATVGQGGTYTQPEQTRSFVYDSIARLKSATNPEGGQIQYGYDNNGNLINKVDARGIVTTYAYDALNRVRARSYNDGTTPTVSYFYDNIANAKGKLTKVSSSVSTTEYTAFDILGRVTASKQTTDGVTYGNGTTDSLMTYTYNLSGALIEQQYPSGRVVKNLLDSNGNLADVKSKKNSSSGPFFDYARNFVYNAAGAVTSMELGNGRYESTSFNSRLQPEQKALGTTPNATNLLKLNYSYGTTSNNGNILSQTITVPTVGQNNGFVAVQNYNYDSLNRLKDAAENVTPTGGSQSQSWKQAFTYDRYGNRNFDEATTTTIPKNCIDNTDNPVICEADRKVYNPAINTANNRLKTIDSYAFDSAGNLTGDAQGRTFRYDGENKQIEVKNSGSVTIGQYVYDGDGKRVKKYFPSSGESTIFVYDAVGKQIAEYSTNVASVQDAKVAYLTNDNLGSPRINTDRDGNVTTRHDYHPFGEEIGVTGGRTTGLKYSEDTVRKKFTGYERDSEIDLDFAQTRTYASALGRFSQFDPVFKSKEHIANPQRWNGYIYVLNAPTVAIDPDGRKPKRVIDVFLTYDQADSNSWKAVQKYAKKHNATINIYTKDAGTATLDQFKKSLGTKDTTVIVVGHSFVPPGDHAAAENGTGTVAGKGVGIDFAGGGVASPTASSKGYMEGSPTLEGVESKARNLVVLTCDFGDTFSPVGSNNKTNFLWAMGGNDGLTSTLGTVSKVGRKMAEIFARGGSAREAQGAGSAILARAPGNDGETMIREVLQPVRKEEE